MKKKKVILSYDYELFFGDRSGTVQKTLIEPTNQLLDAMDSVGFKGNFFIDWQMLKYLSLENDERCRQDHAAIVNQLKDMVRRGHRIELHIHPHWVDAKYNGDGTWNFDEFRHYSLNSFTEKEIVQIFKEGADLLTSIAREVDPNYKMCAFRAGGWAIQPFEKVKKGMDAVGICLESSVMPGFKIICKNSQCDFLHAPIKNEGYYRFSKDVCVEDISGNYIEVPISTIVPSFLLRAIRKTSKIVGMDFSTIADGTHIRKNDPPDQGTILDKRIVATISYYNPLMTALLPFYSKTDITCFIEHPKDVTKYVFACMAALGKIAKSVTYKEVLTLIQKQI